MRLVEKQIDEAQEKGNRVKVCSVVSLKVVKLNMSRQFCSWADSGRIDTCTNSSKRHTHDRASKFCRIMGRTSHKSSKTYTRLMVPDGRQSAGVQRFGA